MDKAFIVELYSYNRWADNKTRDAVSQLKPEQFTRELGNSFPSVRDTVVHIVGAEWIWLERWNGRSPRSLLNANDFPDVHSVKERWIEVGNALHQFLHELTPSALLSNLSYVNRQGETWSYPLWQQMVHVVNHSSYHRGQITTMLRQLKAEPVSTDLLVYYDEKGQTQSAAR